MSEVSEYVPGLVSVVMPSYNCETYIGEAIDSVLVQSYSCLELLICDDCSSDATRDVIKAYEKRDARVRLLENDKNSGAAASRNVCIALARGEYIAFLDSDDIWLPDKLKIQISFMEEHDSDFSCTSYYISDDDFRTAKYEVKPFKRAGYWKILFTGNPLGNSTVIYRVPKSGKRYAPNIRKRNDFALWLEVCRHGMSVSGLSDCLSVYRRRKGSLSSRKSELVSYQWCLYRNVERLSLPVAVAAMVSWALLKSLHVNRKPCGIELGGLLHRNE